MPRASRPQGAFVLRTGRATGNCFPTADTHGRTLGIGKGPALGKKTRRRADDTARGGVGRDLQVWSPAGCVRGAWSPSRAVTPGDAVAAGAPSPEPDQACRSAAIIDTMTLTVIPVPGHGAEDVVVIPAGPDAGAVLTGTEDGVIHRISPDGRRIDRIAETTGRPLGLELLPDGGLLVCDARRGLLRVDLASGRVDALLTDVEGRPMRFCNNAAVAADGTVYFSDSSTVYGIDQWKAEVVEDTRSGRLLQRTPDGRVEVLVDGLSFANGVALARDESYVVVAETSTRRLVRYRLTGPQAHKRELFTPVLPGYPDNIARGSDGLIWVTVASPRDLLVDVLQRAPRLLRRGVKHIPDALQPAPKRTVRVQAFADDGALVHDVQVVDDSDLRRFHMATGVREHEGRVWLGSLHESAVAVLDLP